MDLINSIFEDKRTVKSKVQGKTTYKSLPAASKARRITKSNVSDKNSKPTANRNISRNEPLKNGDNKNDVRRTRSEVKEKVITSRNDKVIVSGNGKDKSSENIVKNSAKNDKEEIANIDPNIIRNFSKFFEENDSIENTFESALEVYNDCTFDEKDAEFGRESFNSLDKDYFVEAYNKEGYELLQTSIQLSFDAADITLGNDADVHQELQDQIIFISDDDTDVACIETYNSVGYELRKIKHQNQPENVIKEQLQHQNSTEEPQFEEKSIQELIFQIHTPTSHTSDIKRSSSSTSKKSTLSRFDSTSSTGSYNLATGTIKSTSYDESVDTDDVIPSLQLSFEVKTKADMIIQELLETEHSYIENLVKIKRDYMRYFKKLRLDPKRMFGNILDILKETIDFYRSLQACGNNYEYIGNTFNDYRHLFELYPEYSKNKSHADLVVHGRFKPILQDRQKFLGDKLDLASYLLNPIQRLGRYILLIENLQRNVRKPEYLEGAIRLVKKSMKKGNDYVAIDSILQCNEVNLTTKGSYIDRERFVLLKPKREEIVLFLFEQIVVFTCQKPNTEKFVYKSSIGMDDLQIINSEGDNQVFQLKNYTKSKTENHELHTYILEARNVKLREWWVQLIQTRLWEQLQQVKALSKTYKMPEVSGNKQTRSITSGSVKSKSANNTQRRSRTASDRNSAKRTSKFYVEETSGYDTL